MNRLLQRQLIKCEFTPTQLQQLDKFISLVEESYNTYEEDLHRIENILEHSSQELFTLNNLLKEDVQVKETMLNQTLQELKVIINTVDDVIFQLDAQGYWKFVNDSWTTITGIKIEDTINHHFLEFIDIIPEENREELAEKFQIKYFLQPNEMTFKILDLNNQSKWVKLTTNPILDKDGRLISLIGGFNDVSNAKNTEELLIQAKENAEYTNKAKDDFLSTMSHEIRTPLNAVIAITNLLIMDMPDQTQIENLNNLKFSSEYLLRLINDVLDFNKIEAGKILIENEIFDIHFLITSLKNNFGTLANNKGIKFKTFYDSDIPKHLIGDNLRLTQILSNIIGNAIKFTEQGDVKLIITLEKQTDASLIILFEIEDTGIGIPKDKFETIFTRFSQAQSNTTKLFGGTGLGLAISQKLICLMDSKIELTSELGKGSKFYFKIQFDIPKDEIIEKLNTDITTIKYTSLKGTKVLVVEDNEINCMIIKQFLSKWEIKYAIAENGLKCLEILKDNQDFDLILMDIQMPVMDGYTATKEIRKNPTPYYQKIPIIALTASALLTQKLVATELGMNDFITKPFQTEVLYNKLKKYMHHKLVSNP